MTTMTKASEQWSNRPADQRFKSLEDLDAACRAWRDASIEKRVPYGALTPVNANGAGLALQGPNGGVAALTHWSFGQLCLRADAPASYLRELPADLAIENLKHGLAKRHADDEASILFRTNGQLTARAILSNDYARIWDVDVTSRLMRLGDPWQPAPAAFDGSRGLYASDHDVFAFMVDNSRRIFETGPGGGLSRGFFVWNSEVGAASFGIQTFLYEYVCGNHRVWGASNVRELRIRHIGTANARARSGLEATLIRYAESSAAEDELKIERARTVRLGMTKDQVLDKVFSLRIPVLGRKKIGEAYGDPTTVWGFTGGLTEVARDSAYADERTALDRAAGKVMDIVF